MDKGTPRVNVVYLEESILGIFGVNEGNEIVERTLYPSDPKQIAAALTRQQGGEITREVSATVEKLIQRGFNRIVFSNRALAEAVRDRWGVDVEVRVGTPAGDYIRDNLEKLGVELGVVQSSSQLNALNREVSTLMAQRAVGRALSERDAIVKQTVQLLDDLDKALNALSGKMREWYGLHFPELSRLIEDHKLYAKLVSTSGDRAYIKPSTLSEAGLQSARAGEISRIAQDSIGAALGSEDIAPIRQLADHLIKLYDYRGALEEYVASLAKDVAPNLSEVAGPVLAARLIEKAGGLRKLSMMPSSTIQLLGAEKAMFRAMKTRSKPPKHGLTFQHPVVHSSPKHLRGRAARSLSAKLAIAARADAFSGNPIGAKLRGELESRIEEAKNA